MSSLDAAKTTPAPLAPTEPYLDTCIRQVIARRPGEVPANIKAEIARKQIFEESINKVIKPIEKDAVHYQRTPSLTILFFQLLRKEKFAEKPSNETNRRIIEAKDSLIQMWNKYKHVDPQLNLLRVFSLRLTSHVNQLLKDQNARKTKIGLDYDAEEEKALQRIKNTKSASCNKSRQTVIIRDKKSKPKDVKNSETVSSTKDVKNSKTMSLGGNLTVLFDFALSFFSKEVFDYIVDLENSVLLEEDKIQWPTVFTPTIFGVMNQVSSHVSSHNKLVLKHLVDDLKLLESLALAPRTLIPIVISSLGDYQHSSQIAFREIEEMLLDKLEHVTQFIQDDANFRRIEKQGSKVKLCQQALQKMRQAFMKNYQPLIKACLQKAQKSYQQAHAVPMSFIAENHVQMCQQLLAELKKEDSTYADILKAHGALCDILTQAPSLPLFDKLKTRLNDQHLLPLNDISVRWYHYSIRTLTQNLESFSQAYQDYVKLIPEQQREMQTDLFKPFDLLTFQLLESLAFLLESREDQALTQILQQVSYLISQVNVRALQSYSSAFPHIADEQAVMKDLLTDAQNTLKQAQLVVQAMPTPPQEISAHLEKVTQLVECLSHFLQSSASYPFLFTSLGTCSLQENSHEHQLAAAMANAFYKRIRTIKQDYPLEIITSPADEEKDENHQKTSPRRELFRRKASVGLHQNWQNLPSIHVSNFIENYSHFSRLFLHFEKLKQDFILWKLEDTQQTELVECLLRISQNEFEETYQILTKYWAIRTLNAKPLTSLLPFSSKIKRKRPLVENKPSRPTPRLRTQKEEKNVMQTLKFYIRAIGHALALPTNALEAKVVLTMRDCYHQVIYHLDSIEDLFILAEKETLSFYQLNAVLTHQAAAIEQTVKLAALVHPQDAEKKEELEIQLKASHQPSLFFNSYLSCPPSIKASSWRKAFQTTKEVDGFLAIPARYGLGNHAWMHLLMSANENEEEQSKQAEESYQAIQNLIQNNLASLEVLFSTINHFLPTPQVSSLSSSHITGLIEGLLDQGKLHSPQLPSYSPFNLDQLETCLHTLFSLHHVQTLSRYETTTDLIRRRSQISSNLNIISVNSEAAEVLLSEVNSTEWCSSYASTLLLCSAVCLEKSMQALLFWLPVSSSHNSDQHCLFSTRAGPGGVSVPLSHTHSIQENATLAAKGLEDIGKADLAQSIRDMGKQFAWLDPFIKQIYRYPFSVTESPSATIPRLFHALAEIRRSINQNTMTEGEKNQLKEALAVNSTELAEGFEVVIKAQLNSQVVKPAHEIMQASLNTLAILQNLSGTQNQAKFEQALR